MSKGSDKKWVKGKVALRNIAVGGRETARSEVYHKRNKNKAVSIVGNNRILGMWVGVGAKVVVWEGEG